MSNNWKKTCDVCGPVEDDVKWCIGCEAWLCKKCWGEGHTPPEICGKCMINSHKKGQIDDQST